MQRFIGGVCIISATTWAGILYGKEKQNYLEHLLYLRHIIHMLKGELQYTNAPLGEIFRRIAVRVKEPYRKWFHNMEKQIERRNELEFHKIWSKSIDKNLTELHLNKEHKRQIKEIGDCIGKMDQMSESKNLELHLENLDQEIKKMRTEIAGKKRIGNCIGIMSGLFLVILLS